MVNQPMLELLAYLRANGFKTFIVSDGGMNSCARGQKVYGIPPEQVSAAAIDKVWYAMASATCCVEEACQRLTAGARQDGDWGNQHRIGTLHLRETHVESGAP